MISIKKRKKSDNISDNISDNMPNNMPNNIFKYNHSYIPKMDEDFIHSIKKIKLGKEQEQEENKKRKYYSLETINDQLEDTVNKMDKISNLIEVKTQNIENLFNKILGNQKKMEKKITILENIIPKNKELEEKIEYLNNQIISYKVENHDLKMITDEKYREENKISNKNTKYNYYI